MTKPPKTIYSRLRLLKKSKRPFFYTNFVQTVDGKVYVKTNPRGYWPIGSALDYQTLWQLRAHADVLMHGSNTASWIRTIDKLGQRSFQQQRKGLGKTKPVLYVIVSANPKPGLSKFLITPPKGVKVLLITTNQTRIPKILINTPTLRRGTEFISPSQVSKYLFNQGYKSVLVEGGPQLLTSFVKAKLIDQLFLTIAPKLFGEQAEKTLTLLSNHLFSPKQIPKLKLLSNIQALDELYLRYQINYPR
ncbi:MAG: RibD family protein [bacterium]